jgi:uncharacterized protein YecE (DUF72 family)
MYGGKLARGTIPPMSAPQFMVGTASWTDKTLIETTDFYPPDVRTAEDRLRFYAAQFKTVEVDSTYYAIPAERNAELWRERTPPGFVFNIKAFAWLTQHLTDASRLPKEIKQMLPQPDRAKRRLGFPGKDALDAAFNMFWSSLGPLHRADPGSGGSLGMLLFQFPPYFICKSSNLDYIASLPERMPGASLAIEFRHRSWTGEEKQRADAGVLAPQRSLLRVDRCAGGPINSALDYGCDRRPRLRAISRPQSRRMVRQARDGGGAFQVSVCGTRAGGEGHAAQVARRARGAARLRDVQQLLPEFRHLERHHDVADADALTR